MMKTAFIIVLLLAFTGAHCQTQHTSTQSGNWSDTLTWNTVTSFPDTIDPVVISFGDSVAVTTAQACNDLEVDGELVIDNGGTLYVDGDLFLYSSQASIEDGTITVVGDLNLDGSIQITPSSSNYITVKGEVSAFGESHITVLDGGLRIYSGLELPYPFQVEE